MLNMSTVANVSLSLVLGCTAYAATPLSLTGKNVLTGVTRSIATYPDVKMGMRGLVVVFLSAKCPCSDSHVAELKRLAGQYKTIEFVAVHSNADEPDEVTKMYFAAAHLPFEVLQDFKGQIADSMKAYKTPHSFLFNDRGEVVYKGGVTSSANAQAADSHYLADAIEDYLAGRTIRKAEGRTLGCVIARGG